VNPLTKIGLFVVTALAEIVGCYMVLLWTRGGRSVGLLLGAAVALAAFAWLLSFHPTAGRTYAAYGGVYVAAAVGWGWLVEGLPPDRWDLIGGVVTLLGMALIAFGPR
jgi:small multidrug resistance family-3 protein